MGYNTTIVLREISCDDGRWIQIAHWPISSLKPPCSTPRDVIVRFEHRVSRGYSGSAGAKVKFACGR